MGKGSSAPAAPDPVATAQAQGAVNKDTAIAQAWLNNMNQYTPYGNRTFQQTGTSPDGTPTFSSTTTLSPEQQQIYNNQSQQQIGLGNLANGYVQKISDTFNQQFPANGLADMQNNINYGSLGNIPTSSSDFQSLADQNIAATRALQNPQWDRQKEQLDTQLANQGVMPGSEAYKNAQGDFSQQRNAADLQAVQAGQQQANTAFNQSLQGRQQGASELSSNANFMNNARQQGLQEQAYLRDLPINEYNALVSGQQVQNPSFQASSGAGQMQAPNIGQYMQNAYQGQLAGYNANQASQNNIMSSLFGLGGAYLMSDKRLKTNIKKIGKTKKGLNIYSYRYKGDTTTQIGVMAQEVEKVMPYAVRTITGGYKSVNYAMVG